MFLIILTYKKPIEEIEKYLTEHNAFLDKYYGQQTFIFSGRRHPRVGGIILANAHTRDDVLSIIQEDPFHQNELADYEIIEFTPTKYDPRLSDFITRL